MRIVALLSALALFAFFFLGVNETVVYLYSFSRLSAYVPAVVVLGVMWVTLMCSGVFLFAAGRNVGLGIDVAVIALPLSALPFIMVGLPLVIVNRAFICRGLINVFVVTLFGAWITECALSARRPELRWPLLSFVVLFILLYGVNIVVAAPELRGDIGTSLFVIISCALFFYLIVNHCGAINRVTRMFEVMVTACGLQVVLSVFSFVYYVVIRGFTSFRVEGMLRDYELFAQYLALHVPLFIFLLRHPRRPHHTVRLRFFLAATLFMLLATATRGPIISLGVGLWYYLVTMRRFISVSQIFRQALLWITVTVLLLALLSTVMPFAAQLIERFAQTDVTSFDTRGVVWREFWRYFQEKPLTGHGAVYDLKQTLFYPHSAYLYYFLTCGIAGGLLFSVFLAVMLRNGLRSARALRSDPRQFECAVTVNVMLIVFIVDSIKIEYTRYPNYQLFIWLIFALSAAMVGVAARAGTDTA